MIEKLKITITNKKKEKEERGEEGSKGRKKGGREEGRKRVKVSFICKNRSERLRASKVTASCRSGDVSVPHCGYVSRARTNGQVNDYMA